MPIRLHERDPTYFREAIRFTAAHTGFNSRLVEKDYFCSVLLEHLASFGTRLTFKGGTLLAKVHASFYRLSEDLDFSIAIPGEATRGARSRQVEPIKSVVDGISNQLPEFTVEEPLRGSNNSTQYNATVSYLSTLAAGRDTIKIEIGLREPIITPEHHGNARTLLLDPVSSDAMIDVFPIQCLSYPEAMAEKLRAALCRREAAIRDFFDIDDATRSGLDVRDSELNALLRHKLAIAGTAAADVSRARLDQLRRQLEPQLRPVLRTQDFEQFDLDRAFDLVTTIARGIG